MQLILILGTSGTLALALKFKKKENLLVETAIFKFSEITVLYRIFVQAKTLVFKVC